MAGLSTSKVYDLMSSGELPSVTIGAAVRVRATDLEQWLADLATEREARLGIRRLDRRAS